MPRFLVAALIATLLLVGCSQTQLETNPTEQVDTIQVESDMPDSEESEKEMEDTEMSSETDQAETNSDSEEESEATSSSAVYTAYSPNALAEYEGKNKVIFFHANWCSTCRALDAELSEKFSELPADTVVLKADYDSETDLRAKYGVNAQHTLVFVDDEGNSTRSNLLGANFTKLQSEL